MNGKNEWFLEDIFSYINVKYENIWNIRNKNTCFTNHKIITFKLWDSATILFEKDNLKYENKVTEQL